MATPASATCAREVGRLQRVIETAMSALPGDHEWTRRHEGHEDECSSSRRKIEKRSSVPWPSCSSELPRLQVTHECIAAKLRWRRYERSSVRLARAAAVSGFAAVAIVDPRPRHRRQHRDLQRCPRDAALAFAVPRLVAARVRLGRHDVVRLSARTDVGARAEGPARPQHALHRLRRDLGDDGGVHRRRRSGTAAHGARHDEFLRRPRRRRRARPHLHGRRRAAGAGAAAAILLSWATWQRRFGGDPAIVGRACRSNTSRRRSSA